MTKAEKVNKAARAKTVAESKRALEQRRKEIVEIARVMYGDGVNIDVDDDAELSEGDDNGCFVQAWVWVPFEGTKFDDTKENA